MERVIKISEDVFTRLFDNGTETSPDDRRAIETAIRNGTPLDTVLGEIKEEIEQLNHDIAFIYRTRDVAEIKHTIYLEDVFQIIDKHREESEEKGCRN